MRALVPLTTAAGLAIAGWLASGIVTVRALEEPARIGLLPSPRTLILFLLPLLVLAEVALRRRRRPAGTAGRDQGRWAGPAALLAPIVVPWLPVPLPVAVLVWTGPLAIAWWLACVVYVYADAFRATQAALRLRPGFGGQVGERAQRNAERRMPNAEVLDDGRWPAVRHMMSLPTRAPLVAAAITGMALAAAAWHTAPQHPKGDEPDYLIITQSLLLDRDLKIEDNHARADYAAYHSNVLPPSYLQRGTDGAIYSVHAPGLPALLVPGFAAAGYRGAVATLVLCAMAGAWLAWRAGWDVTGDVGASWIGMLATVGAAPFFLHGAAIFPDAPASVLALFAVWVLSRNASDRRSYLLCAIALGMLPWLHTRYAMLSVGLGAAAAVHIASKRDWRALVTFATPAMLLAIAWFGFFVVIYGTPSPSAPYGAYTQMALAHLRPGLPGLLFDQQFGLLASAPVLAVALVAIRPAIGRSAPAVWRMGVLVVALALAYTCVVGAYRMWWGGLSAPARFLVPLVLPLAPLIAVAWQSLRSRASRHLVVTLVVVSLAFTAMLTSVDHGALAYNVRDGRARWAVWISPLVDLVAALPAAHRDAPGIVVRDAAVWIGALGLAWSGWRWLERRGRFTSLASFVTLAVLVPVASSTVWAMRGVSGLAPATSQVRFLERRAAASGETLISITPRPVGRTRAWFEVELESSRPRSSSDFTLLRLDRLPAGRYRLFSTVNAPAAKLGVTLGDARAARFIVDLEPSESRTSSAFALATPVVDLVVKGSREAAAAPGRTWIQADEIWDTRAIAPATRSHPFGDAVWLLPGDGIYPEPGGAWLAGDAELTVGVPSPVPQVVVLRAGAGVVGVSWDGATGGEVHLAAGETREVTMTPARGRLRLRTRGGFRPSQVTPGSGDQRYLGVWIEVR